MPEKYFTFPADGSSHTLPGGILTIDFVKGRAHDGNGNYVLGQQLIPEYDEHIGHLRIEEFGASIDVSFWPDGSERKFRCLAGESRVLTNIPLNKVYLTGTGSEVRIEASTTTMRHRPKLG